jgi:glycosyltransferase involved in cell wall biosynthesis
VKLAIVHDWLNQIGGAEGVLETLMDVYPGTPLYTSIYWREKMPDAYRAWDIRTSFLDRWPLVKRKHQAFLPFYPLAFESFDLSEYDLVISNKSGFCHGVITQPETLHICYCLTPTRYVWDYPNYVRRERLGRLPQMMLPPLLAQLRTWDRLAADRVDAFVAISETVRQRIAKHYRRDSAVIYPPVDTDCFEPSATQEDYYLVVSRLVPYKRIDLAVQAFNSLGKPLVVIGDGRNRKALEAMAGPNITLLGRVPFEKVRDAMARCRAFIFPGVEDFGMTPVEAQAAGRPVIAFAGGGALETVIPGETGVLFDEPTAESLAQAVRDFEEAHFDTATLRRNAERFSAETFRHQFTDFVERKLEEHVGTKQR